ncbi:MAG: helix-turn-helix transcriptional regulator [Spirochaetales bacterium]
MTVRKIFIRNMKYYRKCAGLTQEKLAEAIDMSVSYIGDMEARERFPSAETIDKIALALNISPAVLFTENGCPQNIGLSFKEKFSKSLKDELIERITKEIDTVCENL